MLSEVTTPGDACSALERATNAGTRHNRLPGQYYDDETELHYNRFRYYDPVVGTTSRRGRLESG